MDLRVLALTTDLGPAELPDEVENVGGASTLRGTYDEEPSATGATPPSSTRGDGLDDEPAAR